MKIIQAENTGMCTGVRRALEKVEELLSGGEADLFIFNELVHNDFVVSKLRSRGVRFVRGVDEVPAGATLVFSAHGVPLAVEREAERRGLRTVDCTCPLVKKIHLMARSYEKRGYRVILLGHRGHPELTGTIGQLQGPPFAVIENEDEVAALPGEDGKAGEAEKTVFLSQTTLNADVVRRIGEALRKKYPHIEDAGGICYATAKRQQAVKKLSAQADVTLIAGSPSSSNSNRLREIAAESGSPRGAFLIGGAGDLDLPEVASALKGAETVGFGAGASAPPELCGEILKKLRSL